MTNWKHSHRVREVIVIDGVWVVYDGKDLWKWYVFHPEWKSEGVMDGWSVMMKEINYHVWNEVKMKNTD